MGNVILVVAGILVVVLLWIMLFDSTHFEESTYVVRDPRIKKHCRAALIADLHNKKYGRDNLLLLDAIRKEKPDFILVAGDVITAKPGANLQTALEFVGALAKDYPVYYGVGNHEHRIKLYPDVYGDMAKEFEEGLTKLGVSELVNQRVFLEDCGIDIMGSQIQEEYYKRLTHVAMEEGYLSELLGEPNRMAYQILLAHNPDYFPQYAAWGADLVLSGHVHGGVVRIPFWNRGIFSPSVKFFPKYDGGLFWEGNSAMLLSRGLGSHTIPFRLFNPGDLIFIDFCPGEASERIEKKEKTGKE